MVPARVRDEFTLDDVLDLSDYWQDHPPVQWMVQAYLDIKPRPREDAPLAVPAGAIPNIPFKP